MLPVSDRLRLCLVGCGGTGSWLAPSVARIARLQRDQGREVEVAFYDHDHVEPKNIPRQHFYLPHLAENYLANVRLADSVFIAQLGLAVLACRVLCSDFLDDSRRKFRARVRLSIPMKRTALSDHVGRVLSDGSQKVMRGITAGPIIAAGAVVANIQTFRDRSVDQYPGEVMRPVRFVAPANASVAFIYRPQPRPAVVRSAGFIDERPEFLLGCANGTRPVVSDKSERLAFDLAFLLAGFGRDFCALAATAMAEAVRYFRNSDIHLASRLWDCANNLKAAFILA
jgi:hypothetical protein